MKNDSCCVYDRSKNRPKTCAQPAIHQLHQAGGAEVETWISGSDGASDLHERLLDFGNDEAAAGSLNPRGQGRSQQKLVNSRDLTEKFELSAVGHPVI